MAKKAVKKTQSKKQVSEKNKISKKSVKLKQIPKILNTYKEEKILFLDIETSLAILANFSLWDASSYKNVLQDWFIISASWKWGHEKETHSVSVLDDKSNLKGKGLLNPFNDRVVVEKLAELLEEADFVCYHNGDRFDMKKINTRLLVHKMNPVPKVRSIDTLKAAKKYFGFLSNRLDYIAKSLGHSGKIETSKGLWMEVLKGNLNAIKEMVEYNEVDVLELEKVYLDIRPFIHDHPDLRAFTDHDNCCKHCKSTNYTKEGTRVYRSGKVTRYRCKDCGGWWQRPLK